MKHLLGPYRIFDLKVELIALAALSASLAIAPQAASAQSRSLAQFFSNPFPLLARSSSQGYLGVDIADVDSEKAQSLKLKEQRGAVITLVDHDAPAGQVGLKVNDVVLSLNGQSVDGGEQLRKMLKEIPPGGKVSLEISRDGSIQTLAVELAERKTLEHDVWGKMGLNSSDSTPGLGILAGGSDVPPGGGFHMPFFGGNLNVGAMVEPLTSQMAQYLGVSGGLMVKQVSRKSEAATAGFRAFDVILKVGSESISTEADWERSLHSNQGKPVAVTILRDKKQQTLTLQVDSKRRGAVDRQTQTEAIAPSNPA